MVHQPAKHSGRYPKGPCGIVLVAGAATALAFVVFMAFDKLPASSNEAARAVFAAGTALDPGFAVRQSDRRREPTRAIPLLQQALSLYPKGNETIFSSLGSAFLEVGDNAAAIE